MDGDFTTAQERPLSLPPCLVRLELKGFRGELGPVPSSLQELELHACRYGRGGTEIPHPFLSDLTDGDAVQRFTRETSEIITAALPTLRKLLLFGLSEVASGGQISLRACLQTLHELPQLHLSYLYLCYWTVHWEDLLRLLSPAVVETKMNACFFESVAASSRFTAPPLHEGLAFLAVTGCECDGNVVVFSRLPESLRRIVMWMSPAKVRFQEPLPPHLESFTGDASVSGSVLPAGLRKLELIDFPQLAEVPPGLQELKLREYEHPLPPLPDTLETLVLDECAHHVADVPDSVRSLSLYWLPPQPAPPLPARWPARMERLVYWGKYEESGEDLGDGPMPRIMHLPATLRELELNGCEVHAGLPQMLQELRLGSEFTQAMTFTGRVTFNSGDGVNFD